MGVKRLGKIKIHEIAKELGLESKEVVAKAQELGMEVKSHMSTVDDEQANKIRENYNKKEKKATKQEESGKAKAKKEEKQTPVIIRREVIHSDFEEKEEKKEIYLKQLEVLKSIFKE